jgi:hypothetical protein
MSRFLHALTAPICALLLALSSLAALAADDFSAAERALFLDKHLVGVKLPQTLRYRFVSSGSLDPAFDDSVTLKLAAQPDGSCCAADAQFLSGTRKVTLPTVEDAQANPVILYFLERDIHEMQRLTKGQANYFRKRIRMNVFQGAQVREVALQYGGRSVSGTEIELAPYLDDPLRQRFERFAGKRYWFTLSSAVPGGVAAIRTRVAATPDSAPPLIAEELVADGVVLSAPRHTP